MGRQSSLINDFSRIKDITSSLGKDGDVAVEAITNSLRGLDVATASQKLKDLKLNPKLSTEILESASSAKILVGSTDEVADGIKKMSAEAEVATGTMGDAFRGLGTSIKAFFTSTAGMVTIGIAAILAIAKISDSISHDYTKAIEDFDEKVSELANSRTELESLQSEFDETKSRLEELQALANTGSLTFAEEAELASLQRTNDELERKIQLQENLVTMQEESAARAAAVAATTERSAAELAEESGVPRWLSWMANFGSADRYQSSVAGLPNYLDQATLEQMPDYGNTDVSSLLDRYIESAQDLKSQIDAKTAEYSEAVAAGNESSANKIKAELETLQTQYADTTEKIGTYSNEISGYLEAMTDPDTGQAFSFVDRGLFNNLQDELNKINHMNTSGMTEIEKKFNSIDEFFGRSSASTLKSYMQELANAGKTPDELADAFQRLGISIEGATANDVARYFSDMASSANELNDVINSIDGSVDGVAAAFDTENQDADWNAMADYLAQAKELYEAGKVGTDDFKAATQFLTNDIINPDADGFKYDADAYVAVWENAQDKIARYFDSENPIQSMLNFSDDLVSSGLASNIDGEYNWTDTFTSSAKAADALGISVSAVETLMHDLEASGAEFDNVMWSGEGLQEYESSLEGIKSIYDSLEDGEIKDRLGGIIDQSEVDDFANNLENLTQDQIIKIEFEYDLAQIQQQIDELQALANEGDTTALSSLNVKKSQKVDLLESDTGYSSGLIGEYDAGSAAISALQAQFANATAEQADVIKSQISEIYDAQASLLQDFSSSGLSWDEFLNTDEAQSAISEIENISNSAKQKVADMMDLDPETLEVDADTSKAEAKINGVKSEDGNTIVMNVDASTAEVQTQIESLTQGQTVWFTANVDGVETSVSAVKSEDGTITYSAVINDVEQAVAAQSEKNGTLSFTASVDSVDTSNASVPAVSAGVNYFKQNQDDPDDKQAKVDYLKGSQAEPSSPMTSVVNYSLGTVAVPQPVTVKVNYDTSGAPSSTGGADGTAHSTGTAYYGYAYSQGTAMWQHYRNSQHLAYAGGNWGLNRSEDALINELGGEILVRDGKWNILNNGDPTFAHLKAGDILFNHKQSEDLLKNGYVTGSHARMVGNSLAGGSAYANGWRIPSVVSSGSSSYSSNVSSSSYGSSSGSSSNTSSSSSNSSSSNSSSSSVSEETTEEVIDWIERLLKKVARDTEIAVDAIDNAIGLADKQAKTADAISKTQTEISQNQAAFNRYMQEANNVGLDEGYASQVRNGTLNIETITDEDLKTKIDDYEKWYQAAIDCEDQVRELQEQEQELAERRLENIEDYYDAVTAINEAMQDVLESRSEFNEAMGTAIDNDLNISDIKEAIKSQEDTYNQLVQKLTDYQSEFNSLVANGYLKEGSDAWLEGQEKINDFTAEIYDASKALVEYQDKLREIDYDRLQYLIDGFDRAVSKLDKYASLLESRDEDVPESVYQEQIDTNNSQIIANRDLVNRKRDEQRYYDVNSVRYQELEEEISKLEEDALSLMEDNQKLKDSIFEIRIKPLDDAIEKYQKLDDEIAGFMELLNEDAYFDKQGKITEEGLAALALTQQGMANLRQKVADLRTGLDKLQESFDNGVISETEFNEKSEEYRENILDTITNIKDYSDAITDLYMTQLTTEVDALDEIIDKRKEALRRKAEYYDYDKKLRNQTSDLDLLRSQAAALSGVNNLSAQAELKRLNQQIKDAEEELEETRRDHAIDMQEQGYDQISEDMHQMLEDTEYEIAHNAEKQQQVISSMLQNVVGMYESAYGKINSIISNTGFVGSSGFNNNQTQLGTQEGASSQTNSATQNQSNVSSSGTASGVVTDPINDNSSFNSQFEQEIMTKPDTENRLVAELKASPTGITLEEGKSTGITTSIRPNDAKNKTLSWSSSNTSIATVSNGTVKAIKPGSCQVVVSTTDGSGLSVTIGVTVNKKPDPPKPTPAPSNNGGDGIARVGDVVTFSGRYYYDSWGQQPAGNLYSGVNRGVIIDEYSGSEYGGRSSFHGGYGVHIRSADGRYGDLGWVSLSQISGYATGTKGVDKNKLAWTQENGSEMIVRKSDGAVLTQVGKGDAIFPHNLTENLWQWGSINPQAVLSSMGTPNVNTSSGDVHIEQHYDSLLTVQGNVDRDVLPDLERLLDMSYQHNIEKMKSEYSKTTGIKRRR